MHHAHVLIRDIFYIYSLQLQLRTQNITFFFFNDTATTEIYTLSLHDALPIYKVLQILINLLRNAKYALDESKRTDKKITVSITTPNKRSVHIIVSDNGIGISAENLDRKSTRLNSSHSQISYAVFCLKKKKRSQ